ncbi:IS5 family transposase [Micromonospora chalcea]
MINAILWGCARGGPWRHLPERFGPWKTCHERLRRWTADGTWDRILSGAQVPDDGTSIQWTIRIDSSFVRAHQHAAGARKKEGSPTSGATPGAQDGEAVGRSRGGLSTKIHLAVDGRGPPLSILLTAGQADNHSSWRCWTRSPSTSRDRAGPAASRRTDRGQGIRLRLHKTRPAIAGDPARITERSDQVARRTAKSSAGGRPPAFDRAIYRKRNVVERCLNRLKQWRDLATRYAKRAFSTRPASSSSPPSSGFHDRQDRS